MKKKPFYASCAVFVGIAVCVSVWFSLREHKGSQIQGHRHLTSPRQHKGGATENRNGPQLGGILMKSKWILRNGCSESKVR